MRRTDIISSLNARGYQAEAYECIKNGVVFKGIVIRGETSVAPVIYTEQLIAAAHAHGKKLSEVVDEVIRVYKLNKNIEFKVDELLNREFILSHIYVGIQKKSNEEIERRDLKFEGLESYLYIRDGDGTEGRYSAKINKGLLKCAGLDPEEAWKQAEENSFSETQIENMALMMSDICGVDLGDPVDCPMYVVTNRLKFRGASSILDGKALKEFAKKISINKFVVLPSSIHEMLLVPYDESMNMNELNAMVAEINATQVPPEERLTDRAYLICVNV